MNADKPDYKSAIDSLRQSKTVKSTRCARLQLTLGDAYYGDKNQNDAYAAYRMHLQQIQH